MFYLSGFLCCIHLYRGCLFIAISGMVLSIVGMALIILKFFPGCVLWIMVALIFLIIYFLAKLLLFVGIMHVSMQMLLASFIVSLILLIYPAGLCIWQIVHKDSALIITLLIYFIIMEIYYAWVVLSYRNVVMECCGQ